MDGSARPPRPDAGPWALRALLAIALLVIVHLGQAVLVPMVVALVLAFALAPLVHQLARWGVPAVLAAGLSVGALLLAAALTATALSEPASRWWRDAPQTINRLIDRVDEWRASIPLIAPPPPPPRPKGRDPAPQQPPSDPLHEKIAIESAEATWSLLGGTTAFLLGTAASLLLVFFLLASERWLLERACNLFPRWRTRCLVLSAMRDAQRNIGRYIATQAIINAGVGVAIGLALAWLDVPNPGLWGTTAGILNFIPYLGPLLTAALLFVVGAQNFDGLTEMLAPAAAALLVHAIESNFVSPVLVGRRLAMHPLAILVAVMFATGLWGLAGAMLAVPMLIAVRSLCRRWRSCRMVCVLLEDKRDIRAAWRRSLTGGGARGAGEAAVRAPAKRL